MLILSGEAGVGKTRLAEELLRWAELQGFYTAGTRCYASEGELPYAPIVAWLRSPMIAGAVARLEPVWAAAVARLAPDLLTGRADLLSGQPVGEPGERQWMFEALARATSAASQAVVLLLDDMQWCDHSTLEWLHYRLRYAGGGPFIVVATLQRAELDPDRGVAAFLHEFAAQSLCVEIPLEPLGEAETAELAAQTLGAPLAEGQAARFYQESEGNPLFVIELAQAELRERQEEGAGQDHVLPAERAAPLPPRIAGLIGGRLARLSPQARQLAELAAVVGREFGFAILARAGGAEDEDTLVQALDELWQRNIIREHGGQRYDFSHNKLREVLYQHLSEARRRLLHRRIAAAYETLAAQPLVLRGM